MAVLSFAAETSRRELLVARDVGTLLRSLRVASFSWPARCGQVVAVTARRNLLVLRTT
jgi:hypothetical protein